MIRPGAFVSTINPVYAWPAGVLGSVAVRASTNIQLDTPAPVIHILDPFIMYSSPFFTALVRVPATSEPAPDSVTPYACYTITQRIKKVKKKSASQCHCKRLENANTHYYIGKF